MVMQKVTPDIAVALSQRCGKRLYYTNPFWLVENTLWEENEGELVLYIEERMLHRKEVQYLPQKKANITLPNIGVLTDEDLARLEAMGVTITEKYQFESEYWFRTKEFIAMEGKAFASFRKAVHKFKNTYAYMLLREYPEEKVIAFINAWAATKDLSTYDAFAKGCFEWDLDNSLKFVRLAKQLPCKSIFVEIDGKLAGFTMTCPLFPELFVCLQQKVDVQYKGLSRFLYHEKAKLYPDTEFFTLGAADGTRGLETFKEGMHPAKKIPLYSVEVAV